MQAQLNLHSDAGGKEEETFPENSSPQSLNPVSKFMLHNRTKRENPKSKCNLNCLQVIEFQASGESKFELYGGTHFKSTSKNNILGQIPFIFSFNVAIN